MPDTPNFADASLWEIIPDVTVFDEHEERNAKGEVVRRFDRALLDQIVSNNNDRDSKGMLCPLSLGHTKDGVPEKEQPELVGYAREFFTIWDDALKRFVIRCKYYVKKDKAEKAKQYPRTSVELWQKDLFFDPISLIRRTPQLNIPQWTYLMDGQKVRYAMGEASQYAAYDGMGDSDSKKCAKFKKRFAAYAKTLPSKKKLRKFAKKLAKYAGLPSATDTTIPPAVQAQPTDPGQAKFLKVGDSTMTPEEEKRIREDQAAIEKSRYEKRIDELEKKDKERDAQQLRHEREHELKQLVLEGFRLDVADELQLVEGMTAEQFTKHKERIKKQYMRNPPEGDLIRLHRGPVEGAAAVEETTVDQYQKAIDLCTKAASEGKKLAYNEALAQVKTKSA